MAVLVYVILFLPSLVFVSSDHDDIDIYNLHVDCKVTSRFAHTVITSRIANKANVSKEAIFEVELPKTAFITNFSMIIDGVTYVGTVKEKEAAQQQYDTAVSQGQSAGLVKVSGRKMEEFKVGINVAASKKVTFQLTYEELLKRHSGKYEIHIRVQPKQLVKKFKIDVYITEPLGISFLTTEAPFLNENLTKALSKTQNDKEAYISFNPTLQQQRICAKCEETKINGDFIVKYDVNRETAAGDIQIVNGYFVHYFAPETLPKLPKNVIFVIDVSGSMSGRKIEQTREALLRILSDMHSDDRFNLITFSSSVSTWKTAVVTGSTSHIENAKRHVKGIHARGGTNINDAVLEAVNMLDDAEKKEILPERSASIIILLTDGAPTSGVTDKNEIRKNVKNAIKQRYTLYCLGFGYDVDYDLLEAMALENGGVARRIYEDSDSDLQLQGFYNEIATPILSDIKFLYSENAVSSLTTNIFRHYYMGSEIVVAGHIEDNSLDVLAVQINARASQNDLVLNTTASVQGMAGILKNQTYIFGEYTERLWAYLTIQQLLEQIISASPLQKELLTQKALELSLKYNFVTSLTSMVVTKPTEGEDTQTMLADKPKDEGKKEEDTISGFSRGKALRVMNQRRKFTALGGRSRLGSYNDQVIHKEIMSTRRIHEDLSEIRENKEAIQPRFSVSDYPHFIIQLEGGSHLCLNIGGRPGLQPLSVQLINDPKTEIQVFGQLLRADGRGKLQSSFNKFIIRYGTSKLAVSSAEISLENGEHIHHSPWPFSATYYYDRLKFTTELGKILRITLDDKVTLVIVVYEGDSLALYVDSHPFSEATTGLIGQFYNGADISILVNAGNKRKIIYGAIENPVTREMWKDYRPQKSSSSISCWVLQLPLSTLELLN